MSDIEELIQAVQFRWDECAESPHQTLLRLDLLRGMVRRLHADKSQYLAKGQRDKAHEFKEYELQINSLKQSHSLDEDLSLLLKSSSSRKRKTRHLPEALFHIFDRQKFDRYDREWERAITSEALYEGWNLWKLEVWEG